MNSLRPIVQEIFSLVKDPLLIVNTNGEVEYFNNNAKKLLNINENNKNKLEMDETSKSSWTSFLNKIYEQKCGTCTLNVKLSNYGYKKVKLEGYLFKKKKLIFVRFMNMIAASYKEVKEKYSSFILDELAHGVVITSLEGTVLEINIKALQFLHCDYDEIINESHIAIFDKLDDFEYRKLKFYEELITHGQASIMLRDLNDAGEKYYKIDSKINDRKKVIVSTITDVSKEYELKKQLQQKENKREISQIAAGIAHEIRNPMTSLKGFIDLLKNSYTTTSECIKYLNVMDSELQRIDKILLDLLNKSKPKEQNEKVNIKNVVNDVVELMQPNAMKHNIVIVHHENCPDDMAIKGKADQIKQVLINLIKNAIEEMKNGGCITISTSNVYNQAVRLTVKDEGCGIPKEHLSNLFDPFFTTKQDGTGLGLSIVKQIVEEHKGKINVETALNCGTSFHIDFPIYVENNNLNEKENIANVWYEKPLETLPII